MSYLPHRHSVKSVQRFIPFLQTLIDKHKTLGATSAVLDPLELGLNLNTTIARLRDAVQSLKRGLVSDPRINPEELNSIWSQYYVDSDGVRVVVQPRAAKQALFTNANVVRTTLTVDDPSFVEHLKSLAVLLSARILQGEVTINGNLPPKLQASLEEGFDIAITQTGPNQFTML